MITPAMPSPRAILAGRILTGLVTLFLLMDAGLKLLAPQEAIAHSPPLELPADIGFYRLLGGILLVCTALYAWPRTMVLGAVLITGYLGGAIASHLRVGSPLLGFTLFGVYLGIAVWAGLWLRDARVRALLRLA